MRILLGCPGSLPALACDVSLCFRAVRGLRDEGRCPALILRHPALMNFFASPRHRLIWFLYQRELSRGCDPDGQFS